MATPDTIQKLRPEFMERFESFAQDNDVLLRMEIDNPRQYEWVKMTAEVFYAFGRADQAAIDAATLNNAFPNGL